MPLVAEDSLAPQLNRGLPAKIAAQQTQFFSCTPSRPVVPLALTHSVHLHVAIIHAKMRSRLLPRSQG